MFSTVDSPSARFLRIYLVTEKGEEIPILIPTSLRSESREVRTIPSLKRLSEIANRVAQGTWVPLRFIPAVQYYQTLISANNSPTSDFADADPHDCVDCPDTETLREISFAINDNIGQINIEKIHFLRMIEKEERRPDRIVEFQSVRAELWKYRFDADTSQLKATKLLEITVIPKNK